MKSELDIFNDIVDELLKLEDADPVVKLGDPDEMVTDFDLAVNEDPMSEQDFKAVLGMIRK